MKHASKEQGRRRYRAHQRRGGQGQESTEHIQQREQRKFDARTGSKRGGAGPYTAYPGHKWMGTRVPTTQAQNTGQIDRGPEHTPAREGGGHIGTRSARIKRGRNRKHSCSSGAMGEQRPGKHPSPK